MTWKNKTISIRRIFLVALLGVATLAMNMLAKNIKKEGGLDMKPSAMQDKIIPTAYADDVPGSDGACGCSGSGGGCGCGCS